MTTSTRRIFGIETEYGITCAGPQGPVLTPDEAARYLFRKIVAWGRSSNVFLHNGSRLYLDVGSHPEYATAECDSITQLIAHDRAGERILADLISDAQEKITGDELDGTLHLFKNNTDSAGNSYGCHENYLLRRSGDFTRFADVLIPFLITRQILVGAGAIISTGKTAFYAFSQRADHMWEAMSSATTRSRPIINTRDEPHADADLYRRLHVIVGDSSMAEPTTLLKVGSTDLVLRLIENRVMMRDLTLASPMRAIREISHDITGSAPVELADGRTMTAVELQTEYLQRVERFVTENDQLDDTTQQILDLWRRTLTAIATQDLSGIDTEIDWAIKARLIERYQAKHGFALDDPRMARLMLSYHDISPQHSIYHKLVSAGLIRSIVDDADVVAAMDSPPQTTRAKLRGDFIRAAQAAHRDYTVDWVHLKVSDQIQRTVLCKDPFSAVDERVDKLIEAISS